MGLSRREALKLGVLGAGALALPLERTVRAQATERMPEADLPLPFTVPFTAPPLARPYRRSETTDYYWITMRQAAVEVLPGYRTTLWGYDGCVPGPTIDAQQGRQVIVRFANELPAAHPRLGYRPDSSVHLHGSSSLPQYDGYASDVTRPGQYKDYCYPNAQEARTLWYHDHGIHRTATNAYLGLAAMYRLHDAIEQELPIPKGRYDVPLVVNDALFGRDGELLYNDQGHDGLYGDVILVNGRPWPLMRVERRKYRFRILNASLSRSYRWRLDTGEPLVVIGTDGGLVPKPQAVRDLRHSSGERYEVVIDFAKYRIGQRVVLRNLSNKNNVDHRHTGVAMAFEVVGEASSREGDEVPDELRPDNPVMALREEDATQHRRIDLGRSGGQWTINDKTWDDVVRSGHRLTLANPKLGDVEVWELRNLSGGWFHPLHIHLVDYRVLDRNGKPPRPYELGPKDTVYLGENEVIRVVARFGPHPGRYMIHCHNMVHEDHDMMGQFEVGEGGDDPVTAAPARPLPGPPL